MLRCTFLPIATLQSMKVVYFQTEASYRKLLQFQNKMPSPQQSKYVGSYFKIKTDNGQPNQKKSLLLLS